MNKSFELFFLILSLIINFFFHSKNIELPSNITLYLMICTLTISSTYNLCKVSTKKMQIVIIKSILFIIQYILIFASGWNFYCQILSAFLLISVFAFECYILNTNPIVYTLDKATIYMYDIKNINDKIKHTAKSTSKTMNKISELDIKLMYKETIKHSIKTYINKQSLDENFIEKLKNSMNDEYIYLVLSDTGSQASLTFSLITRKEYSHVSIAFDKNLETLVSYNGGQNMYSPGLNSETIDLFAQKDDASMRIYKLKASFEQKQIMIDKIILINEEGSAYNILGLITKRSIKPNIMFCSQFVYNLLKLSNLNYFEKKSTLVKPCDFIEMDYDRKLEFVEHINLCEVIKQTEFQI